MTQNDIAYYNARKEAKDARLRRRETKRHNIASERIDTTKATASLLSAQAAQQNAATNRAVYELDWSKEYGYDYGSDPYNGYVIDVSTGETLWYDKSNPDNVRGINKWKESRGDDIIITIPSGKYGTPQTYVQKELDIAQGMQDVRVGESQATKNFWDTIKSGASTVQILVDTGSSVVK